MSSSLQLSSGFRPGRAGDLLLTSTRPVPAVHVELGSLLETGVALDLQGAGLRGIARPGASVAADLQPHGGWRTADGIAYHCRLWAEEGLSPALRGKSRDERSLLVFMTLSAIDSRGVSE